MRGIGELLISPVYQTLAVNVMGRGGQVENQQVEATISNYEAKKK